MAEKDYHSAQASFEKLVQVKPDAAVGHYLLARTHEALGRHELVEAGLQKSIRFAPNYVDPRVALARLSLKQKNYVVFEAQLVKLETLAPDSSAVWQLQIARARLNGDKQGELEIYEKLSRACPVL
ncbi:MAG: tetratricopeptide repeat protein [Candidatus Reddybacter sp.]